MKMFLAGRPDLELDIDVPRGILGRTRGLIGSQPPGPGRGMLIKTRQVHTFGMSFPIDAIYLSREGSVLAVRTLRPGSMGPFIMSARRVLEMDAGEAARLGIFEGCLLSEERVP